MSRVKLQTVLDREGAVLYSGTHSTLKGFVESLVKSGKSLARADLSRRDLANLDLDGVDFDEALLDGADLRGTRMRNSTAVGASLRGVNAQGVNAEHSSFQGANFALLGDERSHMEGGRFAYCGFDGAVLDGVVMDSAGLSRAALTRVSARKASFREARMLDTDCSFSTFVGSDFDGAKLTSSTKIAKAHQPDRTLGACVVGCSFKGAETDETTPSFSRDEYWTKSLRSLAYVAATGAILAATHQLPIEGESNILSSVVHNTTTLVIATGGALFLSHWISEEIRDYLKEKMNDVDVRLRGAWHAMERSGANLKEMIGAVVRGPGVRALEAALTETRDKADSRGFFSDFWSNARASIVFCDRRHLALALETLCAGRKRHRLQGDVILVRGDKTDERAPTLARYRVDGGVSLAWTKKGKLVGAAEYGRDGRLIGGHGDIAPGNLLDGELGMFETAILEEHGVALSYDRATHDVRAGRDGSIIVVRKSQRLPDNPRGPALLTLKGEPRYFRGGVERVATAMNKNDDLGIEDVDIVENMVKM